MIASLCYTLVWTENKDTIVRMIPQIQYPRKACLVTESSNNKTIMQIVKCCLDLFTETKGHNLLFMFICRRTGKGTCVRMRMQVIIIVNRKLSIKRLKVSKQTALNKRVF